MHHYNTGGGRGGGGNRYLLKHTESGVNKYFRGGPYISHCTEYKFWGVQIFGNIRTGGGGGGGVLPDMFSITMTVVWILLRCDPSFVPNIYRCLIYLSL